MSARIDEGKLRFEFESQWRVARYDGDESVAPAHAFYQNQVSRLPGTKAVDFVGILVGEGGYLIEVKDFRDYRIKNKKRLANGELAIEVAQKVRDTVAGLVGAVRNETNPSILTEAGLLLFKKTEGVRIVLWLEDDAAVNPKAWAEELNTLTTRIQSYLRWLTSRVLVVSISTYAQKPPGIKVANVAGTAVPTR
jgi:hypothetical protein